VKTPTLRDRAQRRLKAPETLNDEAWAKAVKDAEDRGFQLLRFPGLVVQIRLDI
jgi:hypothetical protein